MKRDKLDSYRSMFHVMQHANLRRSSLDGIERLATGAFYWCVRHWMELRRLDNVLRSNSELSFATRRQKVRCNRAEQGCQFSQPLKKALESGIAEGRYSRLPDRDIRLLIANRVINPKKGGQYEVSPVKERFTLLAGWIFVILCLTAFGATAAMVLVSPAWMLLKAFVTLVLLAIFFLFAYSMSCYGILPSSIIKRVQ